ncbi:MAG: formate--tetrahydrofolate ligase, partial [Bdellovibrio sp. CG_4_9_14_3_um_filter_39_7]
MKKIIDQLSLSEDDYFYCHREILKMTKGPTYSLAKQKGKLILVTAMSPTTSGEGKTTVVVALNDALKRLGHLSIATLRQPSLGPVFGMKGGASGGGKASIEPADKIDFGLSGDFSLIESANNLLVALTENHIYQRNSPQLKTDELLLPRCMDMNDRGLRNFTNSQGQRHFVITAASELMAILSLSKNHADLERAVSKVALAYDHNGKVVTAGELGFHKAAVKILHDACYPNLVRSREDAPIFMHAGPFANIAQGTCSLRSTSLALDMANYVVTEAGFGADLGAEKFFDIKCQRGNLAVAAAVLVVTTKAIAEHGLENVRTHYQNLQSFGVPVVITINKFATDSDQELSLLLHDFAQEGWEAVICDGFALGSEGSLDLASKVVSVAQNRAVESLYKNQTQFKDKVIQVATKIYRAQKVEWSPLALEKLKNWGKTLNSFNVCIAKTPLSLSDDPQIKGSPTDHTLHVRD